MKINRKVVAVAVIFAILFFLGNTPSKAQYIDLTQGGVIISQPMRCDEDRPLACVVVLKDDVRYLVVLDAKGEYKIYVLDGDVLKLLWHRETI